MILWPHQLILVRVLSLIWVKKRCLVLSQLVVVVLVVKVLVGLVGALIDRGPEVVDHFLESGLFGLLHQRLVHYRRDVNVQSSDLLSNVIHGFLDVGLFAISGET